MDRQDHQHSEIVTRLDAVIRLLQDLFILEAAQCDMNRNELRKILRIDKRRINKIAKHLKASGKLRVKD